MQSSKIRTLHVTLSWEVISKHYSPTRFVATLGRIIILLVGPEIQIYIYIYIYIVIFVVGMATTTFLYPRRVIALTYRLSHQNSEQPHETPFVHTCVCFLKVT